MYKLPNFKASESNKELIFYSGGKKYNRHSGSQICHQLIVDWFAWDSVSPQTISVTFTSFVTIFCDTVYILHVTQVMIQTCGWEKTLE